MFVEVFDWMISNLVFFWLVIAILFLVLEMGSPGLFFFLSFFFGALIAAGSTFFTDSIIAQSFIFLAASFVSFLIMHFWVKKKVLKAKEHELTNIYALKGKRAKVLKDIMPPEAGKVKVYGEIWSARTFGKEVLKQGEYVDIAAIKGSHLIVKKINS
ncbi:NfeD family protein [Candidatus Dependentiae bacterium]